MIKDLKQIKEHLKGHSEIELPYPFKKDVHIKYITIKDNEEYFYPGGKYIKVMDNPFLNKTFLMMMEKLSQANDDNMITIVNKMGEIDK